MDDKILKVRMVVENMQANILHHFDGYEDVLEKLVREELTTAKIIEQVKLEINQTLKWKIESALEEQIKDSVKKSKALKKKIDALVDKALK